MGFLDSAQRLFVPGGSLFGKNRDKPPQWDVGGQLLFAPDVGAEDERKRKAALYGQSAAAGGFADQGQVGYNALGAQGRDALAGLQAQARGQNSVSAEQLRQGLAQMYAQQQSAAAGASPQNAAGAARTAAIQMGRAGQGMAGQQALAGLQERQQAQQAYAGLLQGLRQQDLNAALGSRQTAVQGFGAQNAGEREPNAWQKYSGAIGAGLSAIAMSDPRLKTDVRDGDKAARKAVDGLGAHLFRYRDERHGAGQQLGTMTTELKRAGLGHTVVSTPQGDAVHGAKAAATGLALTAALAKRVSKLEGKGRK